MVAVLKPGENGLRPMLEADLDTVIAIEEQSYEFPWTRGIFHDCLHVGYSCWVYEENGRVLAYGVMSTGGGEAHILTLVVQAEARGRQVGRQMLHHLLNTASKHKIDTVLLEVRPSNTVAVNLYQSLGFSEIGVRKAYYPDKKGREDALIMGLDLKHYHSANW